MFELWMEQVNALFLAGFGITSDDVEDYMWHDAFTDGLSPREAMDQWKEDMAHELG